MARSTYAEKARRLNAALGLLGQGRSMAEAAAVLSRDFGLSRRQAYRYLQDAQALGHPVAVTEASVPITLKIPANVVRDLRAYAATSGRTLGEIVAGAVKAYLTAAREHG
jgi:predicted DNA-binding transcriptional regulator YafY